ncbi:MAG TPA: hypothetical protein VGG13_02120 [Candidatus Saccharimonadales bacterium]|jgi:hypothetical protein
MKQQYLSKIFIICAALVVAALTLAVPQIVSASCISGQQSCSPTYGVSQTHFGSGGQVNACSHGSTGYCANESAGDLADGNAASHSYQTQAGPGLVTNRAPSLTLIVNNASPSDLGYLSTSIAKTTTATFSVKTYLAGSYQVQIVGNPPKNNATSPHTFAIMNSSGSAVTPSVGTEQFGINLIANTTNPGGGVGGLGANPVCSPASSFCPSGALLSSITSNYNQDGKYFYPNSGSNYTDTLAQANTSTGTDTYTVSFVYNIGPTTPDGFYTYNGSIVATSTF